jgi:hypothetical protein
MISKHKIVTSSFKFIFFEAKPLMACANQIGTNEHGCHHGLPLKKAGLGGGSGRRLISSMSIFKLSTHLPTMIHTFL